jgi:hypothetical protein
MSASAIRHLSQQSLFCECNGLIAAATARLNERQLIALVRPKAVVPLPTKDRSEAG